MPLMSSLMTLPIWRRRPYLPPYPRCTENAPDLVIILFDDLGYGDVGFTGNQIIATPHMDKGVAFENYYAPAPVIRRRAPPVDRPHGTARRAHPCVSVGHDI